VSVIVDYQGAVFVDPYAGVLCRFDRLVRELPASIETRIVAYPTDRCLGYRELEELVRAALPTDRPYALLGESFAATPRDENR